MRANLKRKKAKLDKEIITHDKLKKKKETKIMMITPEGLTKIPLPRRMLSKKFKKKMILEVLGNDNLYSFEIEKRLNALGYKFNKKAISTFIFWHQLDDTIGSDRIKCSRGYTRQRYYKLPPKTKRRYSLEII